MSTMTKKMAKASAPVRDSAKGMGHHMPKKGERFRCPHCGMELQVTADCKCNDPAHVHLHCCGEEMQKA